MFLYPLRFIDFAKDCGLVIDTSSIASFVGSILTNKRRE